MTGAPLSTTSDDSTPDQTAPWWRRGVVYQVYVRSFADSNGDGTGDINGLRQRLPYLRDLGVQAIWLNPWYASPLADGGYDVADYYTINPEFGSNAEAEALIAEARAHGLRVIVDVVPNHTSEEHVWFQEAIASPIGHPSRDMYHIRDGRGLDGAAPPNNWTSVFGGPAWTRLPDGQWYLHLFAPEQPDVNWDNPAVHRAFLEVLTFWLDRGVDGFRVDVAHGLMKDPIYPDIDGLDPNSLLTNAKNSGHPHWDRDEIHEVVSQWRALLDERTTPGDEKMMVAEAWVRPERVPLYLAPDQYHQSFNFTLLEAEWDAQQWKSIIDASIAEVGSCGSAPTWVLSNHDVMREATRFGLPPGTDWRRWPLDGPAEALDPALGLARARAAALVMLALPGSAYVYQGEELGLPEVWDLPIEVLDDPVWERSGHTVKGRDGCRVPIPWTEAPESAGFTTGKPWLPTPPNWPALSAEKQAGDDRSTLEMFRRALHARQQWAVADESLTWITITDLVDDAAESVAAATVAFRRGSGMVCVANFGAQPIPTPTGYTIVAASDFSLEAGTDTGPSTLLPANSSIWLSPSAA